MKLKKFSFLFAVAIVGFAGYYTTDLLNNGTKTEVHASWSYVTDTAEGLIEKAPLIAVAYVDKIEKDSYYPYPNDEAVVFTDAVLEIDEILYSDENLQVGEKITLAQYGGELREGDVLAYHDVPLLEKKQKVLVFLEKVNDDTSRNGKYQYVGGNLGLYTLDNVKGVKKDEKNNSKVSQEVKELGYEKIKSKASEKKAKN